MDELQTGIGTKEAITLKALNVVIKEAKIEEVGTNKAKKVVFSCMHPESPDLIKISQAKIERKGKLEVNGLWFNLENSKEPASDTNQLQKSSALAIYLQANGARNVAGMIGKSVPTVMDEKGYLAFKGY